MDVNDEYYWTEYYSALADKLREFHGRSGELATLMKTARLSVGQKWYKNGDGDPDPSEMDPLSFFAFINYEVGEGRTAILRELGKRLEMGMEAPISFPGVPRTTRGVWRYGSGLEGTEAVEELWQFFEIALDYCDGPNDLSSRENFCTLYNKVIPGPHKEVRAATGTDSLFVFRPEFYVPLDSTMRTVEKDKPGFFNNNPQYGITESDMSAAARSGEAYLALCEKVRSSIDAGRIPFSSIPELSAVAWDSKQATKKGATPVTNRHTEEDKMVTANRAYKLNTILYGPPGTGKTYETTRMALEIIDGRPNGEPLDEKSSRRYRDLVKEGRIGFVTFHQSFSYEDFVEGLRPVTSDDEPEDSSAALGAIRYSVEDGVFKAFCDRARNAGVTEGHRLAPDVHVWKVSLNGTGQNPIRTDCLNNGRIRIGFDDLEPEDGAIPDGTGHTVVNTFWNRMSKGDVVCSCWSEDEVDAIGIIESDARYEKALDSFRHVRDVKWLKTYKGSGKLSLRVLNGGKRMTLSSVYELSRVQPRDLFDAAGIQRAGVAPTDDLPYVFIIDEINRGNVSAIMGELITLVEEDKRLGASQERTVELPYSRARWGVPGNVYVIATMNTADRSLTQLDTALRRRFSFREMAPESSVIKGRGDDGVVEGVHLASLLDAMNKRIRALYDKDHEIGHSVFLGVHSLDELRDAFAEGVIPLLEEYFFDDPKKMRIVLNDSAGDFIAVDEQPSAKLLGLSGFDDINLEDEVSPSFEVKRKESWDPETFTKIYRDPSAEG